MKIALDPNMHGHPSLEVLPQNVAELGDEQIMLSPRDDSERFTRETMQKYVDKYWSTPKV
jgi:hypothetical protein